MFNKNWHRDGCNAFIDYDAPHLGGCPRFVSTYQEFRVHVQKHRERVRLLGIDLALRYYPHLDTDLVSRYLSVHDISKLMTSEERLRELGYVGDRNPSERLFEFYGQQDLPPEKIYEREKVINLINNIDHEYVERFFSGYEKDKGRLGEDLKKELLEIERIADLVDRGMNPVSAEEFSRKMIKASDWVSTEKEREMAKYLELNYRNITFRSWYPNIRRCGALFSSSRSR